MIKLRLPVLIAVFIVSLSALTQAADVRFSRHYDDKMVLQREKPVLIRGFADKGAEVTVSFSGQTKKARADKMVTGRSPWMPCLQAAKVLSWLPSLPERKQGLATCSSVMSFSSPGRQRSMAAWAGMMEVMQKRLAEYEASKPHPLDDSRFPSAGYNAVLHPMRGLAMKGMLLQLGNDYPYALYEKLVREGNHTSRASLGQAYKDVYDIRKLCLYLEPTTIPRIPRAWRKTFGDDSLAVGWITPPGSDLVAMGRHHYEMRELQRRTTEKEDEVDLILPGTEHVLFSAQPADEALLGARCLAWLMGTVYEKDEAVATGPVFDHAVIDYSKAQVFFKPDTSKGLKAQTGALDHFEVAGADLEYHPAQATIDGETIRIKCDTVPRIAHVRYNWTEKPDQGLTNAVGLPALPFGTNEHAYPTKINTLGEEILPEEFSMPAAQWKNKVAVIANGRLNKKIEVPLSDDALKSLRKGRNTLSATYKNTWRWGRHFARNETESSNSVYNSGVHLILEMQEKE